MRLKNYLEPDLVFPSIVADDRHTLNRIVVDLIHARYPAIDHEKLLVELDGQDRVACADGDCIIGVPNAFVENLKRSVCLVVRVSPETEPVTNETIRIGFFLLSPPHESMTHLRLIARISRFACHSGFCQDMASITDATELYHRIIDEDEHHV